MRDKIKVTADTRRRLNQRINKQKSTKKPIKVRIGADRDRRKCRYTFCQHYNRHYDASFCSL